MKYLLESAIIGPKRGAERCVKKTVADGVIATWEVPDHYVVVKEIPKTSVGKIDKKVLRSRYPVAPTA